MGAATGLAGARGTLAGRAGAEGLAEVRRSTGLAGGPVPTDFGWASAAMGFCKDQGTERAVGELHPQSYLCPGCALGWVGHPGFSEALTQCGDMSFASRPSPWVGRAHLQVQGSGSGAEGLLLERHGLQCHLTGLRRGTVNRPAPPSPPTPTDSIPAHAPAAQPACG